MNREKIYLIIIATLLTLSLTFGLAWFLKPDSGSDERIRQLKQQILEFERKEKISEQNIAKWEQKFNALQTKSDSLKNEIARLDRAAAGAEARANSSRRKLERLTQELIKTRKKIEEFKKSPPNRTGDALLESIKNKTSKK